MCVEAVEDMCKSSPALQEDKVGSSDEPPPRDKVGSPEVVRQDDVQESSHSSPDVVVQGTSLHPDLHQETDMEVDAEDCVQSSTNQHAFLWENPLGLENGELHSQDTL